MKRGVCREKKKKRRRKEEEKKKSFGRRVGYKRVLGGSKWRVASDLFTTKTALQGRNR
jgi:hypothetical protein